MDCDKRGSEKAEPVVVVPVCWDPINPELFEDDLSLMVEPTGFGLLKAKDDATLEISVAPGLNALLLKENFLKAPVCCCGNGCSADC